MQPYLPGKPIDEVKRELGLDRIVKLASNENPFGPSPKAIAAVQAAAEKMHLYPDGAAYGVKSAASAKFGIPIDSIMVGNGSDELIHLLGLILLGSESDEMLVADPSFSRYDAAAHLVPCKVVKVPVDAEYRIDLPAMAKAVTENTKLIFIANPNNPTGTIVRKAEFDHFLASIPSDIVVVLDEAYYEFAAQIPDYPDGIEYVKQGKNVVSLRTFSKAHGLAGIRLGLGFTTPEINDAINRAREPFNVNSLAQVAGVAALADDEHVARTVANNQNGLDRLAAIFRSVGATPIESFANFACGDFGRPAGPIFKALLQRGVITRSGEGLGMPTCLRVSVGTSEEMDIFEEALRAVVPSLAQV
jgi:histidinol-phosphate aminotransferase